MNPNLDTGETLSEGSDIAPETPAMAEDCIPLTALAQPDQTEQMANPEVGDLVTYTVEGTVTRVEGENAYVQRKAVNGQEVAGAAPEPQDELSALKSEAAGMQEEKYV